MGEWQKYIYNRQVGPTLCNSILSVYSLYFELTVTTDQKRILTHEQSVDQLFVALAKNARQIPVNSLLRTRGDLQQVRVSNNEQSGTVTRQAETDVQPRPVQHQGQPSADAAEPEQLQSVELGDVASFQENPLPET